MGPVERVEGSRKFTTTVEKTMADDMHATDVPLDPPDLMVRGCELVLPFVCHALISFP